MSDIERRQPGPTVRRPELLLLVPALCMALLVAAVALAQPVSAPDREQIHALISRGVLTQVRRPDFADFRPALDDFYRGGGYVRSAFVRDRSSFVNRRCNQVSPSHFAMPDAST